jgi:hypothetical protein
MGHVFISYSRSDKRLVHRLVSSLENAGFEVWIDREDVPGGARWAGEIVDAIEACVAVLVALSPRSVESDNVRKEMALAVGAKKLVLPVLIEQTTISGDAKYFLADLQQIDLVADFDTGLERLVNALQPIVRGELDSILADPDLTTEQKVRKWIEARARHKDPSELRFDQMTQRRQQADERRTAVQEEIDALQREENEWIADGARPASRTLQRVRARLQALKQERDALNHEIRMLLSEQGRLIEQRMRDSSKMADDLIGRYERLIDRILGKS